MVAPVAGSHIATTQGRLTHHNICTEKIGLLLQKSYSTGSRANSAAADIDHMRDTAWRVLRVLCSNQLVLYTVH